MSDQAVDVPVVEPVVTPAGGDGGQVATPFFETFKEKLGVEVANEDAFYETVGKWKSQAEIATQKDAEVNEWKTKYEAKSVDYKTPFAKDVDTYAAKLAAEGVPLEEIAGRVDEYWNESRVKYREMANENPVGLIERYYKSIAKENDYTPEQVARMVAKESALLDRSKYPAHLEDAEIEQMYQDNLIDLQIKAKGLANVLEEKKPKVGDFHPVGMMTKEQLDAQIAKELEEYQQSFYGLNAKFDGLDFGGVKIPFKMLDEKGVPSPEFAPVLARMNTPGEVDKFTNSLFLESGAINGARVAELMMRESPELQAMVYERAKSDALKEFEARIGGNGTGFGGNAGGGGDGDLNTPGWFTKNVLDRMP